MGFFSRNRSLFKPAKLVELYEDVPNHDRGWYRIAPYDLENSLDGVAFEMPGDEHDRLVLVRVNIGAYRNCDLDAAALERFDTILARWEATGRRIILRAAYDVEGYGYDREPYELSQVCRHAAQVGKVIAAHEHSILVYQGLLIGSWAEMHHSRYLNTTNLRSIYAALREAAGERTYIAIRTPRQIKQLQGMGSLADLGRIALFNDGMMGSATDLATFGTNASGAELPQGRWNRPEELAMIGKLGNLAPLGGEAVGSTGFSRGEAAINYFRDTHVTYLNRTHDPATISRWARSSGPGSWKTLFSYIGAHLGYRFVCRGVQVVSEGESYRVSLRVANTGFGRNFFTLGARLFFEGNGADAIEVADAPTVLVSSQEKSFSALVPKPVGRTQLFMQLFRIEDGMPVSLAHQQKQGLLYLGSLE